MSTIDIVELCKGKTYDEAIRSLREWIPENSKPGTLEWRKELENIILQYYQQSPPSGTTVKVTVNNFVRQKEKERFTKMLNRGKSHRNIRREHGISVEEYNKIMA